jgi:sugar transferase EpsL
MKFYKQKIMTDSMIVRLEGSMYLFVKRVIDMIISGIGLIILSPLLVIISLVILMQMGMPILLKQMRPGLNGKPFHMYKFRTMTDERDEQGNPLSDEQRLTRLGRFLRSTSLDELPELFNVLKGNMSLVGPRPLLMRYLDRYTPEQARRHEVKPGITGWAQVNGRNAISWEEKFAYDVWYVDNWSLWLDMRILAMTVVQVFRREGISAAGEATMTEFKGNYEEQYGDQKQSHLQAAAMLDE